MNGKPWTAKEIETLRKLYPDTPTKLIAFGMRRSTSKVNGQAARLGLHKSAAYMASDEPFVLRRYPNTGAAYRFKPGQAPANKGTRRPGYSPGRMAETQFKKGQRSCTWKPVGTILPDADGYLRIKIRERREGDSGGWDPNVWPALHLHVWKQHHGPIPEGYAVVFRDGNRSHCQIENLELISRADLMRRNSVHNLPEELRAVIQLNGALKRKIRNRYEKQNDGPAQSSVRNAGGAQRQRQAHGC